MSKPRFDKAFSKFIDGGEPRLTTKTFFEVLAEIESRRIERTIDLEAKVVGGQLRFEPSSEISVHENEIVLGNQRLVVRLT
jgi:hypothetical protein